MNLLTGNTKSVYFKYLIACMGSAVATSIYSFIDTIAVGQYAGPDGVAAMAVVNPIWGIIVFLSMLCGMGGAVLMSNAKGGGDEKGGNNYFTVSLLLMFLITIITWAVFLLFPESMLRFFGADEVILPMAMQYAELMWMFFPVFLLSLFVSVFVRNDGVPQLAMTAVIIGGLVNVFGDWFFVFPLDMGIRGAALATVIGSSIQLLILCSRYFSKKSGLKIVKPDAVVKSSLQILSAGAFAGVIDLANAVLVILFNVKIMKYAGSSTLAVYGVICTCASLYLTLFSGVGQTVQPIISTNYGAGQHKRIGETLRLAVVTALLLGIALALTGIVRPTMLINLFMTATPDVSEIAPPIIRVYFLSFFLTGINILATYYFQSILETRKALLLSLLRGIVISGILVNLLPVLFGIAGVWWTMPITEVATVIVAVIWIYKSRRTVEHISVHKKLSVD